MLVSFGKCSLHEYAASFSYSYARFLAQFYSLVELKDDFLTKFAGISSAQYL